MIELFYYPTPNGRKISILLEELKLKYKLTRIDITKNEQFSENFLKISPLNKIPVIIDNQETVFESGAILIPISILAKQKKAGKCGSLGGKNFGF